MLAVSPVVVAIAALSAVDAAESLAADARTVKVLDRRGRPSAPRQTSSRGRRPVDRSLCRG